MNDQDSVRRLAEIRERADKATPGPWACLRADNPESAHDRVSIPVTTPRGMLLISANGLPATGEMRGIGSFIAHSREDVPYLLSVIDSLTAERDRMAAAGCPRCGHALRNEQDHALGSPCPMCGCMSTGGSDGAEAWRIRAEAAEAEVQRLTETDAHALRALAEGWAEEHYLHDSVGAFEAGWEARQPAIDSLTTERDRLALWIGEAIEGKFGVLVATGFADLVACTHTRAEAAEADRERLREVLNRVLSSFKRALAGGVIRDADEVIAEAEAALATPPSEGEQS